MWDTMFNRVQPVFNQFEAGKATCGQIWPKMAKNGRFGGPLRPPTVILVGAKGSKWPIPVCASMCSMCKLQVCAVCAVCAVWASMFKYVQECAKSRLQHLVVSSPHRKMPVPQCPQVPHPQMLGCCLSNIFLVAILKVKALPSSLLIVTMYVMSSVCLQWEFWESTV